MYQALREKNLPMARKRLSYLVGRETKDLDEEEVTKACVETVAENTSDGVAAPLLYLLLGGVPLGFCYKAINTLDSMVGYRNEKYEYFGKASAKLDDAANWLPARICGLLMIVSAWILKMSASGALWVFSVTAKASFAKFRTDGGGCGRCAGYSAWRRPCVFGKVVEKPTIGAALRPAQAEDILRTNRMMIVTAVLLLILFGAVRLLIALCWGG